VYATDPRSVAGVLASTGRLAEVIGAGEQGEALLASLRAQLGELKRRLDALPPRRVLFVVWPDPLISVGRGTFLADALRWAGAESVVDSTQDWPRLSLEEIVRLQPDDLVFASAHAEAAERDFQALRDRPGWRSLEAVRQKHVAVISDAVNRPAPRLIDAIIELARQLHPEAFAQKSEDRNSKSEERRPGDSFELFRGEVRACSR
jgi:iron complex transport system substrate-binding protein